jgi:hypothetical protein
MSIYCPNRVVTMFVRLTRVFEDYVLLIIIFAVSIVLLLLISQTDHTRLSNEMTTTNRNRTYFSIDTCFNADLCDDDKPKVYILNRQSERLKQILGSNEDIMVVTEDIVEACFVVLFVRSKKSMESMLNDQSLMGTITKFNLNLLIVDYQHSSYYNGSILSLKHASVLDCALLSTFYQTPNHHLSTKRSGSLNIDFSLIDTTAHILPFSVFYDKFILVNENFLFLTAKRHYLLTYHECTNRIDETLVSSTWLVIDFNCTKDNQAHNAELGLCFDNSKRTTMLLNSTFTFLMNDHRHDDSALWSIGLTVRLVEALQAGTIPVVFDTDMRLPLAECIRWDEIILFVSFGHFNKAFEILESISEAEVIERRRRAFNVYKAYFKDESTQFRTLMTFLKERLNLKLNGFDGFDGLNIVYEVNQQLDVGMLSVFINETRLLSRYLCPSIILSLGLGWVSTKSKITQSTQAKLKSGCKFLTKDALVQNMTFNCLQE